MTYQIHLEAHPHRDAWRWVCPCGRRGWWADMTAAWRAAEMHEIANHGKGTHHDHL